MTEDKYYAAHQDYLYGIVPLMIHYAWHLHRQYPESLEMDFILSHYVDIYRKTLYCKEGTAPSDALFKDPEWNRITSAILDRYHQCSTDTTSERFERLCFEYLWPLMKPCMERESRPPRKGAARPYGAWSVTFRAVNVMSVHIANVYRPDSVFDHVDDFAEDLLHLILDTSRTNPCVDTVFCGSWMNNLPPFQALFPPEWVYHLHRPVRHNDTNGIWGQYMTRTGGFHVENAQFLRAQGRHRYPLIHSQCGINSCIAYLKSQGWKNKERTENQTCKMDGVFS